MKIEGNNRGEEGTTPVTTACPEAGKEDVCKHKYILPNMIVLPLFSHLKARSRQCVLEVSTKVDIPTHTLSR